MSNGRYTIIIFHPCPSGQCTPMDIRYLVDRHEVRPDGSLVMWRKDRFVARMRPGEWENLRKEST